MCYDWTYSILVNSLRLLLIVFRIVKFRLLNCNYYFRNCLIIFLYRYRYENLFGIMVQLLVVRTAKKLFATSAVDRRDKRGFISFRIFLIVQIVEPLKRSSISFRPRLLAVYLLAWLKMKFANNKAKWRNSGGGTLSLVHGSLGQDAR